MFMLTVFVANLKIIVHTNIVYSIELIVIFLSFLAYFILEIMANYYLDYDLFNILTRIF